MTALHRNSFFPDAKSLPLARRFILVLVGLSGDRIDAAEPTVKVDIRATLRAKRTVCARLRTDAANDAKRPSIRLGPRLFWLVCHFKWGRLPRD